MFFNQKKGGETVLIVDIGSSSVGAAITVVSNGATPKIKFSTRVPISLSVGDSDRSHSVTAITAALDTALNAVVAEHTVFHKSHVIFTSPWYTSTTKVLKIDHVIPTIITRRIIERLVKDAEMKFIEESGAGHQIVESRVLNTKLNGYDSQDPYNKKAKNVEITFFASLVATDILESVRRVFDKHIHIKNEQFSSFSLAAFGAISGLMPDDHDYLIVDVRGEVTDVSLVVNGSLLKSLFFPHGKNALAKSMSDSSGQTATVALSSVSTALGEHSHPTAEEDLAKHSESFKQNWQQAYDKAVQDLTGGLPAPQKIFLMADEDIESFFEKVLNEDNTNGSLHTLKYLNIFNYVDVSSVPTDPFLALESIFVTMM